MNFEIPLWLAQVPWTVIKIVMIGGLVWAQVGIYRAIRPL